MTLPAGYYIDPATYRAEMERFFFGMWICAGRTERIANAGDYFLCDVAGESVIVTRDATPDTGGAIRAFHNVCRHRGTQICGDPQGAFPGRIRCPYHAWTYGLDGQLLGAPQMGPDFDRSEFPLHAVHVELWDGHIFLNLSPDPPPLAGQLGRLHHKFDAWRMADLRLHRRIVYDVRANWKLIVQNYSECLHCPVLHPALNRLTDYLGADNEPPSATYLGGSMGFRNGAQTMSMDGALRRDYLPALDAAQRTMVCYYVLIPNLLLSLHPDYMMTHILWPKAVDRTEIVCEFHFHPEEMAKPSFEAQDAIDFWDLTNREDWHISELSQRGISSRAYTPGPYSPREELLHAFDRIVTAGQ